MGIQKEIDLYIFMGNPKGNLNEGFFLTQKIDT